jgi:uncharacterized membrane protein YkvA (DUF1232 family)
VKDDQVHLTGPGPHEKGHDPEAAWPDPTEAMAPESADEHLELTLRAHEPPLGRTGLFSFYDKLRERVLHAVDKHGGRYSEAVVEALLLVPDVFILLVRLTLDKEVPKPARAMIGGALAYFILPTDLLPEAILGVGGYLDDLVLAAAVLSQAFGGELEPYARKHWSGSHELGKVLGGITETAHHLLGDRTYARLKGLLARLGIELKG